MFCISLTKTICILTILNYNFLQVDCVIPPLSVKKVNKKLIERKRQDNVEMCRLFNEENNHQQIKNNAESNVLVTNEYSASHRIKRDVDSNKIDNPVLKQEDTFRVEKIVDKIYEDLEDNSRNVTYRQRNLKNITKGIKAKLNRRFNFAPAQLLGPTENNTILELTTEQEAENGNGETEQERKILWVKKWKHGILPYFIDPNTYDSHLSDVILKAFDYIEKVSCIRLQRLREKPVDKQSLESVEWLYIANPSGIRQCVHSNERKPNTGVQMVVLGYDCLSQGDIAHEIMHVLGFSHEHTRPDRDRYITVLWENIKPGYKKFFTTRRDDPLIHLPYDYASVLHYPPRAFSKNGQITVMTQSDIKVGQRDALSELDVEKIGIIYGRECVDRNKNYLLKTCPSVAKIKTSTDKISKRDIEDYFRDRIWPYGIVNYHIKDRMEFTTEERDNIKAVLNHIEKETCIEFRDINDQDDVDGNVDSSENSVSGKGAATLLPLDSEETNTLKSSQNKKMNGDKTQIETSTNVSNTTKRLKMTAKLSELSNVTLPSILNNIFADYDTSGESKRRYHEANDKVKRKNNKTKKGKQATKINKKMVLPKSPARRHAANVLTLVRSTKPGCQCPPPGRPNGNKELIINADCFNSVNDLLHLFVHLLGLDHQHRMHDRDSFLHIEWENLTPEITDEIKEKLPPAASAGFAYDYQSVMHYPWLSIKDGVTNIMYPIWAPRLYLACNAEACTYHHLSSTYQKRGRKTLRSNSLDINHVRNVHTSLDVLRFCDRKNDGWAMGHWQGLSWVDVQKLNVIYADECEKRKRHTIHN